MKYMTEREFDPDDEDMVNRVRNMPQPPSSLQEQSGLQVMTRPKRMPVL